VEVAEEWHVPTCPKPVATLLGCQRLCPEAGQKGEGRAAEGERTSLVEVGIGCTVVEEVEGYA
jgi:hypothetical protein